VLGNIVFIVALFVVCHGPFGKGVGFPLLQGEGPGRANAQTKACAILTLNPAIVSLCAGNIQLFTAVKMMLYMWIECFMAGETL
jgi:hypothetical protein